MTQSAELSMTSPVNEFILSSLFLCWGKSQTSIGAELLSSAVVAGKTFYPNHYETLCLGPDECVSSVHFQAVDVLLKVLQFKK